MVQACTRPRGAGSGPPASSRPGSRVGHTATRAWVLPQPRRLGRGPSPDEPAAQPSPRVRPETLSAAPVARSHSSHEVVRAGDKPLGLCRGVRAHAHAGCCPSARVGPSARASLPSTDPTRTRGSRPAGSKDPPGNPVMTPKTSTYGTRSRLGTAHAEGVRESPAQWVVARGGGWPPRRGWPRLASGEGHSA